MDLLKQEMYGLNVQFFVPRGSTYKIETYDQNDVEQTDSATKDWAEYTFG